jgi:hypothetical protein
MIYEINSTGLLFLAGICIVAGLLAGLAISQFKGGEKGAKPPRKGLIEVVQVWRDRRDGTLWLKLGNTIGSSAASFDEAQRDDMGNIAQELSEWAGKSIKRPVPPPSGLAARLEQERPQRQTGELPPALQRQTGELPQTPEALLGLDEPYAVSGYRQTRSTGELPPLERPSLNPIETIRRALESDVKKPLPPDRSIAAQVNDIFLDIIAGTELEKRGIRLMELPGKGMVVMIGLTQYDSVDDVPDPEIKAALKQAVATWEKTMLG